MLPNLVQINTVCPEISEAIQKIAFRHGYKWNLSNTETKLHFTEQKWLMFEGGRSIYRNDPDIPFTRHNVNIPEISIENFFKQISERVECIGSHIQVKSDGTVVVNAWHMSKDTFDSIVATRNRLMKEATP